VRARIAPAARRLRPGYSAPLSRSARV